MISINVHNLLSDLETVRSLQRMGDEDEASQLLDFIIAELNNVARNSNKKNKRTKKPSTKNTKKKE